MRRDQRLFLNAWRTVHGTGACMGHEADISPTRADWLARGFSCALWVDPPGQVWEDYVHSTDELVMVLAGTIELEFDGRRFLPTIGEEILIPAHMRHSVRNVGSETARWLYGYNHSASE
ncbi:MAG: cupin domain-containing protein [Nitrospiraceae bacterium]